MPRDGVVTLFNVDDCKIYKLTADTSGSLTYAAAVDVPGIQMIGISPEYLTKDLPGDAKIVDTYSKLRKIRFSVRHAQISLDVLAILTGNTASYTGSSPNEKGTLDLLGAALPNFFKLEGQVKYLGGADVGGSGDFHLSIHKGKMTSFSVELQTEDYAVVSFEGEGIALTNNDKVATLVENETAEAIASSVDTTAPTVSATSPTDGATGVAVGANITFTFSEDIQYDPNQFTVFTRDTGVVVATTKSYSPNVVTLNPDSDLAATTHYIAVATGVRDKAGNVLAAPSVVNFQTA